MDAAGGSRRSITSVIKKVVLNNGAAVVCGIALILAHVWWFVTTGADRKVEAVSGLGAALVALGIWLAVRPFFRKGICRAIEEATGKEMPPLLGFLPPPGYHEEREAQRPQARRDVIGDRVGLVLIVAGTLLNGYSAWIARFAVRLTMDIR